MTSIITNTSAMTALKVLRQTESALGITQERISTGLKVNNAKDDASTWAISQGIKADVAGFTTMGEGLTLAGSAVKVAAEAATSINDQITAIKQKIAAAQAPGSDKASIQADIDAALTTITNITANASFTGTNMVNSNDSLKVLASTSRDSTGAAAANYIDVTGKNLTLTNGGGLAALKDIKVTRDALVSGSSTPQTKIALTAGTAAGTVQLNYTTAKGEAKSVTLNVAAAATATAMAQSFVQTFGEQLKAEGLDITNLDAAGAASGTLTLTSTKDGARAVSTAVTGTGVAAAQTNQVALKFTDATLKSGDEFRFSVNINNAVKTTIVRVMDGNAVPANLGTDADGNTVVGVGKDLLTDGAAIATQLQTALNLKTEFDATAASATAGTDMEVAVSGSTLTILSASGADFVTGVSLPDADYADLLDKVEAASKVAIGAAQAFGTAQKQIESQQTFLKNLTDSLNTGVGALIDADITAESARLNALQTQQQLATQSLSIANQQSQTVLSLFR